MRPVLCMITDRKRFGGEDALVRCVHDAAAADVHLVQVREKDLDDGALTRLVARCVDAAHGTRTRILVNDRLDVALAAGAHGVHLRADGVPAARVRPLVPRGFIIGRSVHGLTEARGAAADGGLDYLTFGTVFPTTSKPDVMPSGVDDLRAAAAAVSLPVLAIGGVTLDNLARVAQAGIAGIAAIGLFADAAASGPSQLQAAVAMASRAFDTPLGVT